MPSDSNFCKIKSKEWETENKKEMAWQVCEDDILKRDDSIQKYNELICKAQIMSPYGLSIKKGLPELLFQNLNV